MSVAEDVVEAALAAPSTLGRGRLICIDGPAGSGKTTLAAAVGALTGAPVVRMDDLYPGWFGLFAVEEHVLGILAPLADQTPGRYRRYDWPTAAYAEEHVVEPAPLLVLEGVGSGNPAWADLISVLVWVETDDDERLARGLRRDGEEARPHWLRWMTDETVLFARDRTRSRAQFVVPT